MTALASLVATACGGSDDETSESRTTSTTALAAPAYGVGRRDVDFVDTSRSTPAHPQRDLEAKPERTLATVVLYPTDLDESGADAPPARGPFPLVVFAHGGGQNADVYAPLVEPLVEAGYVVALPNFPLTSGSGRPGSDVPILFDDHRNQPGDVSFVVDQVAALSDETDGWLEGRVDADHVAAAGHSLGAATTIGVVYACCPDPRIDAAIAIAGPDTSYESTVPEWPATPMLLIHGANDDNVSVYNSDRLFDQATGPAYYLRYTVAGHDGVLFPDGGQDEDNPPENQGHDELTLAAMTAFLDATLGSEPDTLDGFADAVPADVAEWRTS